MVDQFLADDIGIDRIPVGCEAHQFILARVDAEAAEIGKGGIEQTERVWEMELFGQVQAIAASPAQTGGGPFSYSVEREDSCFVKR